jgi:ferric-dicitrate binding protein FerR (iron transport regulator)
MKGDPRVAERALERVVAEARAERGPELDWDRIAARLDEEPRLPNALHTPSHGFRPVLLLAAAGVLLLIGWFAAGGRAPIALPTEPDTTPHALDGDAIAGSLVDADANDVSVEHAGRAQWTLERGGRATVTNESGVVLVKLDRGALLARVVPSPRKETFVVEAAGTRVAVHGTAFRVALAKDHVDVSVNEGVVLVGSREHPGSGQSLTANQHLAFTLSGAPLAGEPSAREPSSPRVADRRGTPSANRPRDLPSQPSIDEVEKVVTEVFELGATCFQSRTATANGVRVTASTTLTLRALPNGRLELGSLEPPLAPQVQSCVVEGIGKLQMAESQEGIQITRRLELER